MNEGLIKKAEFNCSNCKSKYHFPDDMFESCEECYNELPIYSDNHYFCIQFEDGESFHFCSYTCAKKWLNKQKKGDSQ